jgi:hypothetical protein
VTDGEAAGPAAAVAALIEEYRPDSRRLRHLICLLTGQPMDLAGLVQRCALPRRTVEAVLDAAAADLVREGDTLAIRPGLVASYRERFGCAKLAATTLADPLAARMAEAAALRDTMAELIAAAPAARSELDHVQATPETAVRRALWLDSTYDLDGAALLCLGDHDLTSLAVGQVSPGVSIIVVDIDEATLEYIDTAAARLGLSIRCFVSDLRLWLAEPAIGCADLVFTDPPYTAEGLTLFAARGLQGMANREHGRVVVAYGYSERNPSLGVQGQSAAHRLGLAAEAQLPAFSRYDGAQAVGSASDLYVWRPTSRSWRSLDGVLAEVQTNIYTRGGYSLEGPGQDGALAWDAVPPAVQRVTTDDGFPVKVMAGGAWTGHKTPVRDTGDTGADHDQAAPGRVRLSTLISSGVPAAMTDRNRFAVAADLRADPGAWLLRVLLAVNAGRVAAVVPSSHQDVRDEAGQRALAALLAAKYTLRFLRGQPDRQHTIVMATAVAPERLEPGERMAAWLLRRAHGKVGNIWREGLIGVAAQADETKLTKRDARTVVTDSARRPAVLGARLIDLPRHQIAGLLDDLDASARTVTAAT